MQAILFVLRTGIQWNALPRSLGAYSTVHERLSGVAKDGRIRAVDEGRAGRIRRKKGISWEWQALDCAMTKAPSGGEATGPNPTDRGKKGTKRSFLTDGNGIPLAITVAGANAHDCTLLIDTLRAVVIEPAADQAPLQHLCLDKGYDYGFVEEIAPDLYI